MNNEEEALQKHGSIANSSKQLHMEARTDRNSTTETANLQSASARARARVPCTATTSQCTISSKPVVRLRATLAKHKWRSLGLAHHAQQRTDKAPTVGLEPTTTRLRALRSAD